MENKKQRNSFNRLFALLVTVVYMVMLLPVSCLTAFADDAVQVGDVTDRTFWGLPMYGGFDYGYSEQIYTAEEIGAYRKITSISFDVTYVNKRDCNGRLYLLDTDKESFSDKTDVVSLDDATEVYNGSFPFRETGWRTIEFAEQYTHDPQKNLMIIMINDTGASTAYGGSADFAVYSSASQCSAYGFQNSTPVIPVQGSSASYGNTFSQKNVIRLGGIKDVDYIVSYDANGGTGDGYTSDGSIYFGVRIEENRFTAPEHYYFTGWNTKADGSGTAYAPGDKITDSENITLYAQWAKLCTVAFSANDGTNTTALQEFTPGIQFKLASPAFTETREGYAFLSWNTKPDGSGTVYAPGDKITISENITLYAQWVELCTVTLLANDGTDTTALQEFTPGIQFKLTSPSFTETREGYVFLSWNTKDDGSGESYSDGQSITLDSSTTLYAQWKKAKQAGKVTNKISWYLPLFGWADYGYSEQIYTAEEIGAYDVITSLDFYVASAARCDVKWEGRLYLLDTDKEAFSSIKDVVSLEGATEVYNGSLPSIEGGWQTIEFADQYIHDPQKNLMIIMINDTGRSTGDCAKFAAYSSPSACSLYKYTYNTSVTPEWGSSATELVSEKNVIRCCGFKNADVTYTLSYDANGGTGDGYTALAIKNGSELRITNNYFTAPEHYYFTGWNTKPDGSGTAYATGDIITVRENITLYAQWEKQYTVTLSANDGTDTTASQYFTPGTQFSLASPKFTANREGYYFLSWNTKADGSGESYYDRQNIMLNNGMTLYAQWEELKDAKQVGKVSNQRSNLLPIYSYKKYSYSEQIYTAEEIGAYSKITSISFDVIISNDRDCTGRLYLLDTDKESFSDKTDVVSLEGATEVYNGSLPFNETGWKTIRLTQPFNHDPTKNMVLIVLHYASSLYHVRDAEFATYSADDNCSVYRFGFNFLEPTADADDQNIANIKNVIRFTGVKAGEVGCTITYNANGGTSEEYISLASAGSTIDILDNRFTAPEHKYFTGWNTQPNGNGNSYNPDDTITISEDITLYAQWADKCTVTFASNDGTDNTNVLYFIPDNDKQLTLEIPDFTRNGYSFVCWNDKADGSGNEYFVGQRIPLSDNIVLYAQWLNTSNEIQIGVLTKSDCSLPLDSSWDYGYSEQIYTAEEIGNRNYLTAIRFYLSEVPENFNCNGELYLLDTDKTNLTEAVSLTGATKVFDGTFPFRTTGWQTINFIVPYTHEPDKNLIVIMVNKTGTRTFTEKSLFVCARYYGEECATQKSQDLHQLLPPDNPNVHYPNNIMNYKSIIRLVATNEILHKVTYKSNGGIGADYQSELSETEPISLLGNKFMPPEHYYFTGWNTDPQGNGTAYAIDAAITTDEDMILYAQWREMNTVTFIGNNGTNEQYVQYFIPGEEIRLNSTGFTKVPDRHFNGWATAPNNMEVSYLNGEKVTLKENTVLYAVWGSYPKAQAYYDFYDDPEDDGWFFYVNDYDGSKWFYDTTMYNDHTVSSQKGRVIASDGTKTADAPDNWVITPECVIDTNNPVMSFWAKHTDPTAGSELIQIHVANAEDVNLPNKDYRDWTMIAAFQSTNNWEKYTVDLSDFAGQRVFIAIQQWTSTKQSTLLVDDVTLPVTALHTITVSNDIQNGSVTADMSTARCSENVTLTVTPDEGYQMKTFIVNGKAIEGNTFTMPNEDVTVSAEFETIKTEIIINSVDINGIKTAQNVYAETFNSEDYSVPNAPYMDGYTFMGWNVNGDLYSTEEAANTAVETLVKAKTPVTIEVVYEKDQASYNVSVIGGKISTGRTSGTVQVSKLVTVKADTVSGKTFSHWERNGKKVSTNSTYSFYMPSEDVALEAVFTNSDAEQTGAAIIESVKAIGNSKVSFVSVISVPKNGKFVRGGLVATSDSSIGQNVTTENAEYVKLSTKATANTKNLKYTWTKSFTDSTVMYVRSYLVYKELDDTEIVVYSDAVKANVYGIMNN